MDEEQMAAKSRMGPAASADRGQPSSGWQGVEETPRLITPQEAVERIGALLPKEATRAAAPNDNCRNCDRRRHRARRDWDRGGEYCRFARMCELFAFRFKPAIGSAARSWCHGIDTRIPRAVLGVGIKTAARREGGSQLQCRQVAMHVRFMPAAATEVAQANARSIPDIAAAAIG